MTINIEVNYSLHRLSSTPHHHFFGYYGIDPWDSIGKNHLALETESHKHRPIPTDTAKVGLVNRETKKFTPYANTFAYNLQQGSMMHWIGEEFTFNDWEEGCLVSRALNPVTGEIRTIQGAIAAVSPAEPMAIGLNYQRMALCRRVVGYASELGSTEIAPQPEDDGLFQLNLQDGTSKLVLSIAEVISKTKDDRLNADGKTITFDSVHEDSRQIYLIDLTERI